LEAGIDSFKRTGLQLYRIGRWVIRYLIILFLVAALTSQARADLIAYEMTGTITRVSSEINGWSFPLPVARGDHMTWTFQYDRSTPASGGGQGQISYTPNGPLITNLVDQTNGPSMLALVRCPR
jgi:hypothetical protein